MAPLSQAPKSAIGRAFAWPTVLYGALGLVVSVAVTLLGLVVLTFVLARMLPADPVYSVLGDYATPEQYAAKYIELGLDRPIWEQLAMYVGKVFTADFGKSIITNNDVMADIFRTLPASIELALFAFLFAVLVGVPLGVIAAAYRNSAIDFIVRVFGLVGYSAPNFWLALVGLMIFYGMLGWLPGPGRISVLNEVTFTSPTGFYLIDAIVQQRWDVLADAAKRLLMPSLVLAYSASAYIMRMTRSFMLEQLSQEYVVLAAAKGMSYRNIVWVQAFRAIRVQLVTVIVLVLAGLLEGSVLVETVFAWSGLGRYMTNAMMVSDMNAVVASVLFIGVIFVSLNLIADLLYRALDPRTR
jgi:peptide/nickel transport system permease protein